MKATAFFLVVLATVLAFSFLPSFLPRKSPVAEVAQNSLPWQIERLPAGGSRVFGLTLGRSTLEEARARFGKDVQAALMLAADGAGGIEVYFDTVTAGFVSGKMILTLEVASDRIEGLLQQNRKMEFLESSARRVTLHADDLTGIAGAPIAAIAFIPTAQLDEQIVLQRFGPPVERIRSSEHAEHFLYPEHGLDLMLDGKGRELLQYVAPRDFARLRAPLVTQARKSTLR